MWWTDERIRLFKVAADNSTFHSELKNLLLPYISKSDSIIELGCGLGYIVNFLTKDGYNIVGLDSDEKAYNFALSKFPNSNFILGDAFNVNKTYDVVISIFFGRIKEEDNLEKLLRVANKRLIYVQNEHAGTMETQYAKSKETAEFLKRHNINFQYSLHRLSFDQPLKDEAEAEIFIKENYKNRKINISIEKTNGGLIAKNNKAFGLFIVEKED